MGRVFAMGGLENGLMFRYLSEQSGRQKPNFLFVATASEDKPDYYARISLLVSGFGCDTRPVYLLRRRYTPEQIQKLLDWADIIYVCGGDTFRMMQVWQKTGFDRALRDVFEKDSALLCGSSAGGICWFRRGFSDSSRTPEYGKHGWVDGLGIFPDRVFCPHFADRGEAFEQALRDSGDAGFGMDNNTAWFYDNGRESFVRTDGSCRITVYGPAGTGAAEPESLNLAEYYGV